MERTLQATIPEVSAAELDALPKQLIHRARNPSQADIYRVQWHGQAAVLKDFRRNPRWLRLLATRFTVRRELHALQRAAGVRGVPQPLARLGADAFLMTAVAGRPLPDEKVERPPLEFFVRLGELVAALHAAGIAHGDLRRTNIMLDEHGRPHLLDFASAIVARSGWLGIIHRFAYRQMVRVDQWKLAKLKAAYYPTNLTAAERATLAQPPWYLHVGHWYRHRLYPHLRRLWRGSRGSSAATTPTRKLKD